MAKHRHMAYGRVLVGNRLVKIYRSKLKTGQYMYTVPYYLPGTKGRQKHSSMDESEAMRFAFDLDNFIAKAKQPEVLLQGEEALIYKRVERSVKSSKKPLDVLVGDAVWAEKNLEGHELRRVVQYYVDKGMLGCKDVTVEELKEEYLSKAYRAEDTKSRSDSRIRQFVKWLYREMGRKDVLLSKVTTPILNKWIHGRETLRTYGSKMTEYHCLITLFNLARRKNWLPRGEPTAAHLVEKPVDVEQEDKEITLFEPEELRALIEHLWAKRNEHPKFEHALYGVLLGAFLGMRRKERVRVTWEHFDLERKRLYLSRRMTKTRKDRGMPLPPNLVAFLVAMGGKKSGRLVEEKWVDVANEELKKLNHQWQCNGLRHTFASCWSAIANDDGMLAKYMGTSVQLLPRSYVRYVPFEKAEMLFGIYPPGYTGPIVMGVELVAALKGGAYQSSLPTVADVVHHSSQSPVVAPVVKVPEASGKMAGELTGWKKFAKQLEDHRQFIS